MIEKHLTVRKKESLLNCLLSSQLSRDTYNISEIRRIINDIDPNLVIGITIKDYSGNYEVDIKSETNRYNQILTALTQKKFTIK